MTTQTKVKHDKAELTEVMRHGGTAYFLKIGGMNIAINDDYVDNAREIVKRYNSQPELLEACQDAMEEHYEVRHQYQDTAERRRIWTERQIKIHLAIAKAEGSL